MNSPLRLRLLGPVFILAAIGVGYLTYAEADESHSRERVALVQHDLDTQTALAVVTATVEAMGVPLILAAERVQAGLPIDASDCARWLGEGGDRVSYVAVVDRDGRLLCATLPFTAEDVLVLAQRESVHRALATQQGGFTGPYFSTITGTWIFARTRPLTRAGEAFAVAVAATDSAALVTPLMFGSGPRPHTLWHAASDGIWLTTHDGRTWQPVPPGGEPTVRPASSLLSADEVWSSVQFGNPLVEILLSEPTQQVLDLAPPGHNRRVMTGIALSLSVAALAVIEVGIVSRVRGLAHRSGEPVPGAMKALTRDELDAVAAALDRRDDLVGHAASLEAELAALRDDREQWAQRSLRSLNQAVEKRMPFLRNHGQRVGMYAGGIGRRMGLSDEDVARVQLAGELHDIGKMTVADAVYLKPGRLEPIELSEMQLHTVRGEEIIKLIHPNGGAIAVVARHHHERWDGTGYPDGLAGEEIPLWARIVAVADAYDAMTEDRLYRTTKTHEEALAELRAGTGVQWDPRAVDAFLQVLDE